MGSDCADERPVTGLAAKKNMAETGPHGCAAWNFFVALIPGLTLIGNPKNRVSVVSFVLDGIPVPEVGTLLDKEGIAVRAGHHCAQPALRALGYEMSVRPTFALYNTRDDVDKLVIAVRKIVGER